MNKLMKISALIVFVIYSLNTYSQTTTINYLTSSLSTSACNVFNPSVNINGVSHSSWAGGATFSTVDGVILSTTPQALIPGGTAFVINYYFTPGYNYSFQITAKGNNYTTLNASVIPNFNQFSTSSISSCSSDPSISSYRLAGYGQLSASPPLTNTT
jgi:hypothetical protein